MGITTYDNDAVNSSNHPIFDFDTDPDAVTGATGTGNAAILDHWVPATPEMVRLGLMLSNLLESKLLLLLHLHPWLNLAKYWAH